MKKDFDRAESSERFNAQILLEKIAKGDFDGVVQYCSCFVMSLLRKK